MEIGHKIIGISVSVLIAGIMVPMGITQIANATTTNWDPSVALVFQVVLPVLAVKVMGLPQKLRNWHRHSILEGVNSLAPSPGLPSGKCMF